MRKRTQSVEEAVPTQSVGTRITRIKLPWPIPAAWLDVLLSILLGSLYAWLLYGRFHLDPTQVSWITNAGGDALQHQLGWEWFRVEPWRFPLGTIQAYGYPIGTSITFMDSIPLLAIPFKLLSPWLPQNFQYFGLWETASVTGQVLLGLRILREFTPSLGLRVLGATLLVLSPPQIYRAFYHSSLSAHWILLAGIWFVILEYRQRLWRGAWLALLGVTTWVHVYFIPMLLPLWAIGMFFHYRRSPRKWLAGAEILAGALIFVLAGASTGLFSLSYDDLSAGGNGYGVFSWNLNGLFNPMHFSSSLVRDLKTYYAGQLEGYSYLGLGNLLMLAVAGYLFLVHREYRGKRLLLGLLLAASLVYMAYALSHQAYFGETMLWNIPLSDSLDKFLNMFRTSGRFIWPVFYLVVLFGISTLFRRLRYAGPVLAVIILLQLIDLQPLLQFRRNTGVAAARPVLVSDFWQAAGSANQHLVILPEPDDFDPYAAFPGYALRHRMTLNLGYFARSDERAFADYNRQVWEQLQNHQPDPRTLYVLTDPEWVKTAQANLGQDLFICKVDGFRVLFARTNSLASAGIDLARTCGAPAP